MTARWCSPQRAQTNTVTVRYGLGDKLVYDQKEPQLAFYDTKHAGDPRFGPHGQFVQQYYAFTMAYHRPGALDVPRELVPADITTLIEQRDVAQIENERLRNELAARRTE